MGYKKKVNNRQMYKQAESVYEWMVFPQEHILVLLFEFVCSCMWTVQYNWGPEQLRVPK